MLTLARVAGTSPRRRRCSQAEQFPPKDTDGASLVDGSWLCLEGVSILTAWSAYGR